MSCSWPRPPRGRWVRSASSVGQASATSPGPVEGSLAQGTRVVNKKEPPHAAALREDLRGSCGGQVREDTYHHREPFGTLRDPSGPFGKTSGPQDLRTSGPQDLRASGPQDPARAGVLQEGRGACQPVSGQGGSQRVCPAHYGASTAGFGAVLRGWEAGGGDEFIKVAGFRGGWRKKFHAEPPGRLSRVRAARVRKPSP